MMLSALFNDTIQYSAQIHKQGLSDAKKIDSLQKVISQLDADNKHETVIKYINAIGNQWPFLLLVFAIIIILLNWKNIRKWSGNIQSVRGSLGNANLEINSTISISETTESVGHIPARQDGATEDSGASVVQSVVAETIDTNETDSVDLYTLYVSLKNEGLSRGEEILDVLQTKANSVADREWNLIFFAAHSYRNGLKPDYSEIERILDESEIPITKARALRSISDIHLNNTQFDKAIEFGLKAISLAWQIPEKEGKELLIYILLGLNDAYLNLRKEREYIQLLISYVRPGMGDELKAKLYKKVSEVYKSLDQPLEEAVFLIKAVDYVSNDTNLLFNLAYAFSDLSNSELGLFYYRLSNTINSQQSNVLNNMGVALDHLGLHAEAGQRYTQSYLLGNSLAGANIANKYIGIGMHEAATKILDDIKANSTDIHQNVYKAYETMEKMLEGEREKFKVIAKDGLQMSIFFRRYANAVENERSDSFIFNFENLVSANVSEVVTGNDIEKRVVVSSGIHSMSVQFPVEIAPFGVCSAVLNYTTNQYLTDTFKGHFVFDQDGLHITLSHVHIHSRRECRFYQIQRSIPMDDALLLASNPSGV